MHRLRTIALVALVALPSGLPAFDGGFAESDVLDSGDVDTQATYAFSRYGAGQGNAMDLTPRVRIGLPGSFDTAFAAPMRRDNETEDQAFRHLRGELGYRLPAGDTRLRGAVRAYATFFPEPERQGVGTGSKNFGISGNWVAEDWLPGTRVHLRSAVERLDLREPEEAISEAAAYQLGNRLLGEAGLEFRHTEGLHSYWGLQATTPLGSSDRERQSLSFRPGLRLDLAGNWHLDAVAQFNTVSRDVEPRRAGIVTLSYGHRAERPDWEELARQIASAQVQLDSLDTRVRDIERRLRTEPETLPEPEGVHVINQSGIPELEAQVAELLAREGFEIGRTEVDEDVGRLDRTTVEYAPGYAEQAREAARALPGFQTIEPNEDLPDGVQVRVLVGFDLE